MKFFSLTQKSQFPLEKTFGKRHNHHEAPGRRKPNTPILSYQTKGDHYMVWKDFLTGRREPLRPLRRMEDGMHLAGQLYGFKGLLEKRHR